MQTTSIKEILKKQRDFFATGKTLELNFRLSQLKKLRSVLFANQQNIVAALKQDLHRSEAEVAMTEFMVIIEEVNLAIKKLPSWIQAQKKSSPFPVLWPGRSDVHFEPYGSVFIIAPWNYPFQLALIPVIGAIAAGNCVIVKPSEMAQQSEALIASIINDNFAPELAVAIQATPQEMSTILEEQFDYIFFTGGTKVGKIIQEAAAKHLTPTTLELGGKSPCIVDASAKLDYAARRIVWGKFMNAGQTCIAPDYLLVHASIKNELITKLKENCAKFYGDNPALSADYGRIINQNHFERLTHLLQSGKVIYGGTTMPEQRYIAPTFLDVANVNDAVMQEEIFGPLLPIITFNDLSDAIKMIRSKPKPLSLYLFSTNAETKNTITKQVSFGSGCMNDCLLQITNYNMPFGGVGASGLGNYHGYYSFVTFSHQKSIFTRRPMFDFSFTYPPFSKGKLRFLLKVLGV